MQQSGRYPEVGGGDETTWSIAFWDRERRLLKIGTTTSLERRQAELEAALGRPLVLVTAWPGGRAEERALHRRWADHRIPGTEWFRPHAALDSWLGVDPDTIPQQRESWVGSPLA